MKTKQCTCCNVVKPEDSDHFYRSKMSENGLHNVCRPCQAVIDREKDYRKFVKTYGIYSLEEQYVREVSNNDQTNQ